MKTIICFFITICISLIQFSFITFAKNDTTTIYNLMIFVRFKGEKEFLGNNQLHSEYIRDIVNNTCNNSVYSVNKYYHAVSNEKMNLKTVYLFSDDNFSSFETSNTRGYYSKYDEISNPQGYHGQGTTSVKWSEWLRDWGQKASNAVNNGQKIYDIDGNIIPFADLDSNKDGYIDCLSLIYNRTSDGAYSFGDQDILWGYQANTSHVELPIGQNETICSNRFIQASMQIDESSLYKDAENNLFLTPSTIIHELGHLFGLKDLYCLRSDITYRPVNSLSPMGKQFSPITQFLTSYERYALDWLGDNNISQITQNGTYSLKPVSDKFETGNVAYKIKIPGQDHLWMYLEYRYVENENVNRFNAFNSSIFKPDGSKATGIIRPSKSGLLVYVVNTNPKFPDNSNGPQNNIWGMQVLGGTISTRADAPQGVNGYIYYGGININVTKCDNDEVKFTVLNEKAFDVNEAIEIKNTEVIKHNAPNTYYEIKKTIANNYKNNKYIYYICAIYNDNNTIATTIINKKQINSNTEEIFTFNVDEAYKNCKLNFYIWDENLKPYCDSELVDISDFL